MAKYLFRTFLLFTALVALTAPTAVMAKDTGVVALCPTVKEIDVPQDVDTITKDYDGQKITWKRITTYNPSPGEFSYATAAGPTNKKSTVGIIICTYHDNSTGRDNEWQADTDHTYTLSTLNSKWVLYAEPYYCQPGLKEQGNCKFKIDPSS